MNYRRNPNANAPAGHDPAYSTHWWWLPAVCWVGVLGTLGWQGLNVSPPDLNAPSAQVTTPSDPMPAVLPGA